MRDDLRSEADDTRRHNEIARAIREALELPDRSERDNASTYTGTRIASNATCTSLNDVLAVSDRLIMEYQRIEGMTQELQDEKTASIVGNWKQNVGKTEKQLKSGARVAQRNVLKVLGADLEDEEGKISHEDGDENTDTIGGLKEPELNMELQRTLRYTERAVRKMVKGLPNEDET